MLKFFWLCWIFFEHVQIFLTVVKSDILPYEFAYLSMVKNIWPHSNILNVVKKIWTNFVFELADGLGIILKIQEFHLTTVDF